MIVLDSTNAAVRRSPSNPTTIDQFQPQEDYLNNILHSLSEKKNSLLAEIRGYPRRSIRKQLFGELLFAVRSSTSCRVQGSGGGSSCVAVHHNNSTTSTTGTAAGARAISSVQQKKNQRHQSTSSISSSQEEGPSRSSRKNLKQRLTVFDLAGDRHFVYVDLQHDYKALGVQEHQATTVADVKRLVMDSPRIGYVRHPCLLLGEELLEDSVPISEVVRKMRRNKGKQQQESTSNHCAQQQVEAQHCPPASSSSKKRNSSSPSSARSNEVVDEKKAAPDGTTGTAASTFLSPTSSTDRQRTDRQRTDRQRTDRQPERVVETTSSTTDTTDSNYKTATNRNCSSDIAFSKDNNTTSRNNTTITYDILDSGGTRSRSHATDEKVLVQEPGATTGVEISHHPQEPEDQDLLNDEESIYDEESCEQLLYFVAADKFNRYSGEPVLVEDSFVSLQKRLIETGRMRLNREVKRKAREISKQRKNKENFS